MRTVRSCAILATKVEFVRCVTNTIYFNVTTVNYYVNIIAKFSGRTMRYITKMNSDFKFAVFSSLFDTIF